MPTFLFWNLHDNPNVEAALVQIASQYCVDVLVLAEAPQNLKSAGLLSRLNRETNDAYDYFNSGACRKIQVYSRFNSAQFPLLPRVTAMSFGIYSIMAAKAFWSP